MVISSALSFKQGKSGHDFSEPTAEDSLRKGLLKLIQQDSFSGIMISHVSGMAAREKRSP